MSWMTFIGSIFRLLFLALKGNFRHQLMVECLLVRQENACLKRKGIRPKLKTGDRLIFGLLTGLVSRKRLSKISSALSPATLLSFHRALVNKKYSLLYSSKRKKPGPKGPSPELIRFVTEAKRLNPFYGCEKIALLATQRLQTPVSHQTVRRILLKHHGNNPGVPGGPSWWTFFAHTKDSLWALDLFRVESTSLQSYWVMVVMDVWSRKIIGFSAHKGVVYGEDLCHMFNKIVHRHPKPRMLSTDNDPLFKFDQWKANLRIMEIDAEKKSIPYVPISHPFIERAIGTTRRELLDKILIWNQTDLERKLGHFKDYYNLYRVHSSLNGETPLQKRREFMPDTFKNAPWRWKPVCRGLFHVPLFLTSSKIFLK